MSRTRTRVLALSGGIGGAKLVLGLSRVLPDPGTLLVVVANPGDDFEHLGLTICPDLDTLVYTLSGLADPARGWGRRDETSTFMAALETLGGETWFQLGDGDLALHVERTRRLGAGDRLSAITDDLCRRLGVGPRIVPACDQPLRTVVDTADGALPFQHLFRPRPLRAGRTGLPVRRRRRGPARPGDPGSPRRPGIESGGALPLQPLHQYRSHPRGAGTAAGPWRRPKRRWLPFRRWSAGGRSRGRWPRCWPNWDGRCPRPPSGGTTAA